MLNRYFMLKVLVVFCSVTAAVFSGMFLKNIWLLIGVMCILYLIGFLLLQYIINLHEEHFAEEKLKQTFAYLRIKRLLKGYPAKDDQIIGYIEYAGEAIADMVDDSLIEDFFDYCTK